MSPAASGEEDRMSRHIMEAFETELERLRSCVVKMGDLAASQISDALDAVAKGDEDLAARTIERDRELDELERRIAEDALTMLALRQPMAGDLRAIVSAIKIPADLERIGDLAKGIARCAAALRRSMLGSPAVPSLAAMGQRVRLQLKRVLQAYQDQDAMAAEEIWRRDEQIDNSYSGVFRELLTYMMEDPRTIGSCTQLMFLAKNLERMGDHCTHIAEQIHFVVKGERFDGTRPKGADPAGIDLPNG
jgi:phosphate transport system protein